VLEIACGTGWWTPHGARDAAHWLATDANEETLAIARTKPLPAGRVEFRVLDAYALEGLGTETFDAAFAGFWWSHVPRERLKEFLASLHARLEPGASVILLDNLYVEGNSTPIVEADANGNTYQLRQLGDGSRFRVMKNYPTKDELRGLLPGAHYRALQYHWLAQYKV
jgi:demethylmenaquinone methyltransferase/2-methoxy-6-polyprenyl-1,4-benzoquinol methylase